jgi:N-acetylglucosamine malate deacetylase 1
MPISRRRLLFRGLPLLATLPLTRAAAQASKLRVIVTGGHPGDPECGCAGTIARYTELGHEVVILYLNRGQGYCGTSPLSECAAIRTTEAEKACRILKASPVFAKQVDSHAVIDDSHYEEFRQLLEAQKPDLVFTQWPVDTHGDHRAVSSFVLNAWLKGKRNFALYYYEVADDTIMFSPDEFVDISGVEERRHAACYAHVSQSPDKWYPAQTQITKAEAFLRVWGSKRAFLP